MREIVFDTETTGLDPSDGHRVIELGCIELIDHLPTGANFHRYLNPERLVPPETTRVHGLTDEFLADKPLFAEIVDEFLEFLGDAPLVIHNAAFDIKFVNSELQRLRRAPIPLARAIDTIEIAKAKIPGVRYSLDDLCKRFGIDISARTKHGALLDAELTALLYLELIGGRQTRLELAPTGGGSADGLNSRSARQRPAPLAPRLSEAEAAAHALFVESELGAEALWHRRRSN
ncbi:MAG: DNA polymerase III subunit epsilon [Alphaproteobacteria bacterium]|nr:DNA polymerase III subunit epsilon [Alphaproteobacteria bacterium]MBU6471400.1 DNA polymerase III subunit epsilon [Alphaproteobacteria bacterium]MDE2012271.1 DNA polymerase III subunit epsilon [Alphaproteobacteria bacterium]MDE2072838.1 DNA polymerase III subunit epsilon [Alphaproteobacteria bacterium]MDE2351734.1 DNA polymerase III subunit epsilon [Alphaproteobacteria bacterium]